MTKETLISLGLTSEQAEAVTGEWAAKIEDYITKEDYNKLESTNAALRTELTGVMGAKESLQAQLDESRFNYALEQTLTKSGVRKLELVKRLLDLDKLELGGKGDFKGLEEQLDSIRKEAPALFHSPENKQSINTGSEGIFRRQAQTQDTTPSIGERLGRHVAQPMIENPYYK